MRNLRSRCRKIITDATSSSFEESIPKGKSQAGLYPRSRYTKKFSEVSSKTSVKVVFARKKNKVTLQRFLLGLLVFKPEKIRFLDLLALYENQLNLEQLALRDEKWRNKFGSALEACSKILRSYRFSERNYSKVLLKIRREVKESLNGFYLPERNLKTVYQAYRNAVHLVESRPDGKLKKHIPPKKFIGMGYGDKGSRRDPAWDGSPSWQDVALSDKFRNLE